MKKYKVLFCDLDGTLIDTLSGDTFPRGIWDMKFKFNVLDIIKKFAPEYVFIVSNQGGIEKKYVNKENFEDKMHYICGSIEEYCNVPCVAYSYCPTNDTTDKYRKPNVGMLKSCLKTDTSLVKSDCLMIGDASGLEGQFSDSDKKTAENFGIDYLDVNEFIKKYS